MTSRPRERSSPVSRCDCEIGQALPRALQAGGWGCATGPLQALWAASYPSVPSAASPVDVCTQLGEPPQARLTLRTQSRSGFPIRQHEPPARALSLSFAMHTHPLPTHMPNRASSLSWRTRCCCLLPQNVSYPAGDEYCSGIRTYHPFTQGSLLPVQEES